MENQGAHYTNEQIISMSEAKTGVNMFRVLITPWKQNLAKDPYIKHVKVSRKLPDTIKITIEERVEKYAVAVKANTLIIDAEGVGLVFDTNSPYIRIDGLDLAEPVLGQKIKDSSKVKNTEKALGLLKTFEENQIPVVKLAFSEVLLSVSIYDKLTCKAEYDVIIENMENLKEILADLKSKNIERGTIRLGKDDYLAWSPSI